VNPSGAGLGRSVPSHMASVFRLKPSLLGILTGSKMFCSRFVTARLELWSILPTAATQRPTGRGQRVDQQGIACGAMVSVSPLPQYHGPDVANTAQGAGESSNTDSTRAFLLSISPYFRPGCSLYEQNAPILE